MVEHILVEQIKYKSLNGLLYDDEKTAEFWDAQWREQNQFTDKDYAAYIKKGKQRMEFVDRRLMNIGQDGIIVWRGHHETRYYCFHGLIGFIRASSAMLQDWYDGQYLTSKADLEFYKKACSDDINTSTAIIGFIQNKCGNDFDVDVHFAGTTYT